jgi:hypothetical protein
LSVVRAACYGGGAFDDGGNCTAVVHGAHAARQATKPRTLSWSGAFVRFLP